MALKSQAARVKPAASRSRAVAHGNRGQRRRIGEGLGQMRAEQLVIDGERLHLHLPKRELGTRPGAGPAADRRPLLG